MLALLIGTETLHFMVSVLKWLFIKKIKIFYKDNDEHCLKERKNLAGFHVVCNTSKTVAELQPSTSKIQLVPQLLETYIKKPI